MFYEAYSRHILFIKANFDSKMLSLMESLFLTDNMSPCTVNYIALSFIMVQCSPQFPCWGGQSPAGPVQCPRRPTAGIREDISYVGAVSAHAHGTGLHVLRLGSKQRTLHSSERIAGNSFLSQGNSSVLSCETNCTSLMSL